MLIALVAWLPLALKRLPLSLPFICIALRPLPICCPEITERFTEFVVIIALMGAGLKIERLFRLGRWAVTCGCWPSPCGSASWPSRCWASGPGRSAARSLESRAQLNNAGSRRRPRDFQLLSNRPDMLRRERRLWAEQRRRPIGTTPELARQIREILARLETLPKVRRVEQGRWGLPINKAPPRVWR